MDKFQSTERSHWMMYRLQHMSISRTYAINIRRFKVLLHSYVQFNMVTWSMHKFDIYLSQCVISLVIAFVRHKVQQLLLVNYKSTMGNNYWICNYFITQTFRSANHDWFVISQLIQVSSNWNKCRYHFIIYIFSKTICTIYTFSYPFYPQFSYDS